MDWKNVGILASKELSDLTRGRWFWLQGGGFGLLVLALSAAAMVGSGYGGLAGFDRTTASLINLLLLVVPLMGLAAGAQSVAPERERGTLAYLLAQPVSRGEVYLGKFLGQAAGLSCSLGVGFGLSGLVLGGSGALSFCILLALSLLLAWCALSLGMLISTLASRATAASGLALLAWVSLTLLGDLGLMGATMVSRWGIPELLLASLANPLQVFKITAILMIRSSLEVLGPAGLYATRTYGTALLPLLLGLLIVQVVLPLALGAAAFGRRSAV